jgi:transposase
MRIIALDVHRSFAQMAVLEKGIIRDAGKVDLERGRLLHFAKTLKPDDEVVLEATGNTSAIVRLLSPFVARVVIANPNLVRAIAWAKVKTDKIDARVLAKLHASGFLPEVWMPDEETETRRRVSAERTQGRGLHLEPAGAAAVEAAAPGTGSGSCVTARWQAKGTGGRV